MAAGVEAATEVAATEPKMEEQSGEGERPAQNEKRKEKNIKRGGNRFEAFITNIPFDVKWQSLKDLVKQKVGEVTYMELLMDAEGKSRRCAVVDVKMEESMKKAAEVLNKDSLSGRPLKVKEDPDGEHARRAMQKVMAMTGGTGMGPGGPGMINIAPSILNNPNIPNEIIHALQAGGLGSTVFIADLDYKFGWKKLKEVFSMAYGKSHGIGTVTFEQSTEAMQALSMFNGQLLFDRPMHVKMDERAFPKGYFFFPEHPQQLPHGLGGIGTGLGPGGQPIDANRLNKGIGMGNLGPAGMGMEGIGFGINKMGGIEGPFGGGMENMGRFGSGMNMGRISKILSNALKREEIIAKQGGGWAPALTTLGRVGGRGGRHGMHRCRPGPWHGLSHGLWHQVHGLLGLDHMASSIEHMDQTMEHIGSGTIERMGSGVERMGPAIECMGLDMEHMVPRGMGPMMDHMVTSLECMGTNNLEGMSLEHMGPNNLEHMGLERMDTNSLECMGPAMGAGIELMGLAMGGGGGASFDRAIEMEHGNFGGSFVGSFGGTGGHAPRVARKACQIFVRNLPFDFTWKMENGKSKGCGVVKFELPEVAERACWMMNGMKLSGREIDVRINRNV
ncbi:hypothetical protein FD755_015627 [Muntiacus reevesi]|uniref:RRM domain-containing protein n=1 Tax=Muntiacus reevesi TaxID=9886 RepID=A0A5N3XHY2_MUNRE|nr:hypothetical protein FD755_015627 [Muntiacus reevesi]